MKLSKWSVRRCLLLFLVFALIAPSFPLPAGAMEGTDELVEREDIEIDGQYSPALMEDASEDWERQVLLCLDEQEYLEEESDVCSNELEEETEDTVEIEIPEEVETPQELEIDVPKEESSSNEEKSNEEVTDLPLPDFLEEENQPVELERTEESRIQLKVETALEKAKNYYLANPPEYPEPSNPNHRTSSHSNYWIFSALWGAGFTDLKTDIPWKRNASPWEPFSYWSVGINKAAITAKEDAGIIIGSVLLGKDPRKFGNEQNRRDVVQDLIEKQRENGSFSDMFGEPWIMIALDLVDADYNREAHLRYILSQQTEKGSFGGADATGWVLIALAPYMDRPEVKEAVEKVVQWVHSSRRLNDGEIAGQMSGDNSNSVAAIIHGLAAVGEDLYSDKWTMETTDRGSVNLIERFIDRYQLDDGRFKWKDEMLGNWQMATEQSLLALADTVAGESTFQRLYDYRRNVLDQTTRVSLRVEGRTDTILPQQDVLVETIAEEATPLDALKQALKEKDIYLELSGSGENPTIEVIGEDAQEDPHPAGKWHVLVNGMNPPAGLNGYPLVADDEVVIYYGNVSNLYLGSPDADELDKLTLLPEIQVVPERPMAEQEIKIVVRASYDIYDQANNLLEKNVKTTIKDALVHYNGKEYLTDKEGIARIPADEARAGTYELLVTKDIENSYPHLLRQVKRIVIEAKDSDTEEPGNENPGGGGPGNGGSNPTPPPSTGSIRLAVHGPVGEGYILSPTMISLQENDTAYSVLERAMSGQVDATGRGSSLYVRAIAGLAEFDRGQNSGWMYAVNGSYPNYSSGVYRLKDGDRVDWRYTLDLGKDIGAGQPGEIIGEGGSGGIGLKPELVQEMVSKLSISAHNQKPVHEVGTTVIVMNQGQRMSQKDAEALLKQLQLNKVNISQTFSPQENGLMTDAEKEVGLFVPEGAISASTNIQIQKWTNHNFNEAISGVFTFSPAGTKFNKPVQISIKTPLLVEDLEQLALVWWNAEKKEWIPVPAIVDAKSGIVTGIVDHFSAFAVIDKSKLDVKGKEGYLLALENALQWINQKENVSDWDIVALARAGEQIPPSYLPSLEAMLIEQDGQFRKVTDYERIVLALTAIGQNPYSFVGYDLIEKIYNNESMTLQGINGPVFALISLDSNHYTVPENAEWTREKLVQYIVEQQNEDGGFSLSTGQVKSDVDLTAMVLQALAKYKHLPEVEEVIDKALIWLSLEQNSDGGYTNSLGEINSESVAQVIIALSGLGIDIKKDQRFLKAEGNLLSNLLSFASEDGGFAHVHGQESNEMATEQAALALVACHRYVAEQLPLFDMRQNEQERNDAEEREMVPLAMPFVDLDQISPWAYEAVQQAWATKLMQGTGGMDPRFEPKRSMTRAEFATLLVHALGEDVEIGQPVSFDDVNSNDWFYNAVSTAYAQGWIKGVSEHSFAPNQGITREEVAVVIGRWLALEEDVLEAVLTGLNDRSDISAWAEAMVSQVYHKELMIGNKNQFNPKELVSREMAAVLMMRVVED